MNWLWKSCYDVKWYGDQKNAPGGRAALVFLVLSLILAGSRVAVLGPTTARALDKGVELLRKEIPPFKIIHGVASTDSPQPWSKDFEGGVGLVIDTTGKTGLEKYTMGALLTRNQFVIKQGNGQTQSFDLAKVESFDSQGPQVDAWAAKAHALLYPVLIGLMAALTLAGLGLRWLLSSFAALLVAQGAGVLLDWKQASRMAALALVPASYVTLIGVWTPLHVVLLPTLVSLFLLGLSVWLMRPPGSAPLESGRFGP